MGCPNWVADSVYVAQNHIEEIENKNEIDDVSASGIIMAAYDACGTWAKRFTSNKRSMELGENLDVWIRCSVDRCDLLQEAHFCIADRDTWELLPLSNALAAMAAPKGSIDNWKPTILPTCCGSLCKYLMVATGRASVFMLQVKKQPIVKVWDHAVGMICVFEAGGQVTNWDGSELQLASVSVGSRSIVPRGGGILVTNGILHNQLLKMI
eukprot:Gb_22561 [translate_table: standard]